MISMFASVASSYQFLNKEFLKFIICYMKLPLLILLAILPLSLLAQENKSYLMRAKVKHGSMLIGGNLTGYYYKTSDELSKPGEKLEGSLMQASLKSKTGYFIWNDFAVGLDVFLVHNSEKIDGTETETVPLRETYLLAGPFVRYYLLNGVFGEASIAGGLHNFSTGFKSTLYEGSVGVGYAHFINEKFSLEPILSFRYFYKSDGNKTYVTYGPMIGFGVQAYLLRKKAHVIKTTL